MNFSRGLDRSGLLMLGAAATAACATTSDETEPRRSGKRDEPPRQASRVVTFNKHVMPLIQQQCQACHHEGGRAVRARDLSPNKGFKNLIRSAVVSGRMPGHRSASTRAARTRARSPPAG